MGKLKTLADKVWKAGPTPRNYRVRMFTNLLDDTTEVVGGTGTIDFQAAIDALPSNGGRIVVPAGDYSATVTPGSLVVGSKVVTWIADKGVTLPADMPGAVESTGVKLMPALRLGNTASSGDAWYHINLGDYNPPQGNDGTWHSRTFQVEGHLENSAEAASEDNNRLLAAYGFRLTTNATSLNSGRVRGLSGSVNAIGGSANIRAVHVLATSNGGHTGQLTGGLFDVDRVDQTNQVAHASPIGDAVVGECGAGVRSAFNARSNSLGPQRPSYGFFVQHSNAETSLRPEIACFQGHGGGNGDIFQGLRSDTNTDIIYSVDNVGRTMSRSFASGRTASVPDDTKITITSPHAAGTAGILFFWGSPNSTPAICFYNSGPSVIPIFTGSAIAFTTGSLTGTTGTDGKVTISPKADGTIDIENRIGSGATFNWLFMCPSSQNGQFS